MITPNPMRKYRIEKATQMLENIWKANIKENLKRVTGRYRSIINIHYGSPAVVIGAGPSLPKNSYLLTKLKPNTITVCCDKAVPNVPITPTYVVALNSEETDVNKWIAPASQKSTLILPFSVYPRTGENWQSDIIWVNLNLPISETEMLKQMGYPPLIGGSNTGVFSYLLAVEFGCNPIVLVGMDYSFKTRKEVEQRQDKHHYLIWEGTDINGEVRYGTWDWYDSYVAFCEYAEKAYQRRGTITINCTEGGFLYDNRRIIAMPLKSAIEEKYV